MRYILLVIAIALWGCGNLQKEPNVPIANFSSIEPLLHKNNDSTYVINFWATWCTPCVKEFPHFERVAAEYKDKKVRVVMINLDFPDQYEKRLIPFLKERKSNLDVIMLDDPDANAWINKVSSSWSGSLPFTIIYSSKARTFYETTFEFDELNNAIINHLN